MFMSLANEATCIYIVHRMKAILLEHAELKYFNDCLNKIGYQYIQRNERVLAGSLGHHLGKFSFHLRRRLTLPMSHALQQSLH